MTTITRRTALRGGAAAAAIAAVPAITPARGETTIEALERRRRGLKAALRRNYDAWCVARATLPAWARPGRDQFGYEWGWPELDLEHPAIKDAVKLRGPRPLGTRPKLDEVQTYNRDALMAADKGTEKYERRLEQGRERVRHWCARRREQKALKDQAGVTTLTAKGEALCDKIIAVEERICETPAETISDLAIKLRIAEDIPDNPDEGSYVEDGTLSVLRDIERLAGGAS